MVLFVDLSETLVMGVLMMHLAVKKTYGTIAERWFAQRKDRMNSIFLNLMRGEMTERVYWEIFCDDPAKPAPVTADGLKKIFSKEIRVKIPGTRKVLENITAYPRSFRLHETEIIQGRPEIYLVSDHIFERIPELKKYHPEIFSLVSEEIWSFQRGEIKSDRGFFDRVLCDYGLRARETLFIDDLPVNCHSANDARIKSLVFTSPRDLMDSMESLGFKFSKPAWELL